MTDAPEAGAPVAPAVDPVTEHPVMLEEWCVAHSRVERGVELLSAFHAIEGASGPAKRTPSEWLERLAAFGARPC